MYLNKAWCENLQKSLFENQMDFIPLKQSLIQNKQTYNHFICLCDELLMADIGILEKEEKLINFMSELFLEFCETDISKINHTKNTFLANEIKKYLKRNIDDDILLEDISTEMNLSVVHILRVFKKEFGLPIHSYLLNKKVHLAKSLLAKNIPISQVAVESGFFDQSHLTKSFKRVFQLTPKEYQQNILTKC